MILHALTKYGPVQGIHCKVSRIASFKGIPYARAPVGSLRWQAPVEPDPWTDPLMCADYIANPMQPYIDRIATMKTYPMSEDCLYLNVWTPAEKPSDRLPVAIWIYGGAYKTGSSVEEIYDGEEFGKRGVILVTFNYRVGPLGFFCHKELMDEQGHCGNYGTLDQIAALRWVHENIAAFGGDPENVTVFGQSAGAHGVMTMCTSPLTQGLFAHAIIESTGGTSGLYLQDEQSLTDAVKEGETYLSLLGVSSVEEARALPASEIVEKLTNAKLSSKAPWFPKTDGYVLPDGSITAILKNRQHKIDYMFGATSWETGFMQAFMSEPTVEGIRAFAERVFPMDPEGYMSSVDLSTPESRKQAAFDQYENDKVCANLGWQALELARGGKTAYLYHFTKQVPSFDGKRIGPYHSAELPYVFGTLDHMTPYANDSDRELSRIMIGYWTNFMKNGDPNGEGLPVWKRSSRKTEAMEFGERIGMFDIPLSPNREFIADYMVKLCASLTECS